MSSQISIYRPKTEKVIRYSLNNALSAIEKLALELNRKGFLFERNFVISNYNFDFFCLKSRVAIEIDSYAHEYSDVLSRDAAKKLYIQSYGITVFKFTDYQILTDMEEIIRALKYHQSQSN